MCMKACHFESWHLVALHGVEPVHPPPACLRRANWFDLSGLEAVARLRERGRALPCFASP